MASLIRRLVRTLTSGWDYKVSSVVQKRNRCSEKKLVLESAPDSLVASKKCMLTPQQHHNEVLFGYFIWEQNLFPWFRSDDSESEEVEGDTADSEGDTADSEGDSADSEGEKVEDDTEDDGADSECEKEEATACNKEDAQAGKGEEKNKAADSGTSVTVTPQAKLTMVKNMEAEKKIRKNVEKGDTMKKKAEGKLKPPMRFVIKMEVTQVED